MKRQTLAILVISLSLFIVLASMSLLVPKGDQERSSGVSSTLEDRTVNKEENEDKPSDLDLVSGTDNRIKQTETLLQESQKLLARTNDLTVAAQKDISIANEINDLASQMEKLDRYFDDGALESNEYVRRRKELTDRIIEVAESRL